MAEQDRLLTAFTYAMDFYNTAQESAWLSCLHQDNPEVAYERFRLGVADLLKRGLVAVEERNCGGKHYSLTHAGLLACPEGGDPHNIKRPHGWTEEDENRLPIPPSITKKSPTKTSPIPTNEKIHPDFQRP